MPLSCTFFERKAHGCQKMTSSDNSIKQKYLAANSYVSSCNKLTKRADIRTHHSAFPHEIGILSMIKQRLKCIVNAVTKIAQLGLNCPY